MLRWIERALFAIAIPTLLYCGFVLADTWVFQRNQRQQLEHVLATRIAFPIPPKPLPPVVKGDLIGLIQVPRLGLSVIVIEGDSAAILRRAAGHIPGTAQPGEPGNVAISGHRDTFFQPLQNIRTNDVITLTTPLGEYSYRVVSTKVVSPYDVAVLSASRSQILTLVTCYPFYFVGPAPERFIVRAERVI
jgi:sortase A